MNWTTPTPLRSLGNKLVVANDGYLYRVNGNKITSITKLNEIESEIPAQFVSSSKGWTVLSTQQDMFIRARHVGELSSQLVIGQLVEGWCVIKPITGSVKLLLGGLAIKIDEGNEHGFLAEAPDFFTILPTRPYSEDIVQITCYRLVQDSYSINPNKNVTWTVVNDLLFFSDGTYLYLEQPTEVYQLGNFKAVGKYHRRLIAVDQQNNLWITKGYQFGIDDVVRGNLLQSPFVDVIDANPSVIGDVIGILETANGFVVYGDKGICHYIHHWEQDGFAELPVLLNNGAKFCTGIVTRHFFVDTKDNLWLFQINDQGSYVKQKLGYNYFLKPGVVHMTYDDTTEHLYIKRPTNNLPLLLTTQGMSEIYHEVVDLYQGKALIRSVYQDEDIVVGIGPINFGHTGLKDLQGIEVHGTKEGEGSVVVESSVDFNDSTQPVTEQQFTLYDNYGVHASFITNNQFKITLQGNFEDVQDIVMVVSSDEYFGAATIGNTTQ